MVGKEKNILQKSTKQKMADAFVLYAAENHLHLNSLSISQLARLSRVHRVSFYHNFKNMHDFINWFLHRDLVLQVNKDAPITIDEALTVVYSFVIRQRPILKSILESKYRKKALAFIADEALTYQLMNFSRIDVDQNISKIERKTYGIFIAQGITALIEAYIMDDEIKELPLSTYLTYSRNLIKDYIERLVELRDKN
jgi:hypothetical protein